MAEYSPKALKALGLIASDPSVGEEVLEAWSAGFWEEWDCDLFSGVSELGFGGEELRLAAQAALPGKSQPEAPSVSVDDLKLVADALDKSEHLRGSLPRQATHNFHRAMIQLRRLIDEADRV